MLDSFLFYKKDALGWTAVCLKEERRGMEKQLSIKRMTAEGCVGMIRSSVCSKKKDVHWTAVGYKRQMNRLAGPAVNKDALGLTVVCLNERCIA